MIPTPTPFGSNPWGITQTFNLTFSCAEETTQYQNIFYALNGGESIGYVNIFLWLLLAVSVLLFIAAEAGAINGGADGAD